MQCFLTLLLILWCSQLVAADLDVVSGKTGYSITVSGTLREGDLHTLTEIFRGRGEFPTITRLEIEGGDTAEAMRLGALYRSAHLSILAMDSCENTCFLWLVGGVSRIVSSPVKLDFGDANQDRVRTYLTEMDVESGALEELSAAFSDETVSVSVGQFERLVGERPGSFNDWVVEQCGAMANREREYLQSIHAASFTEVLQEMRNRNPEREDLVQIIAKYEKLAEVSRGLEYEYKKALSDKWLRIQACRRELVASDQQRVLASLT